MGRENPDAEPEAAYFLAGDFPPEDGRLVLRDNLPEGNSLPVQEFGLAVDKAVINIHGQVLGG
jgi:hypothetical protein